MLYSNKKAAPTRKYLPIASWNVGIGALLPFWAKAAEASIKPKAFFDDVFPLYYYRVFHIHNIDTTNCKPP